MERMQNQPEFDPDTKDSKNPDQSNDAREQKEESASDEGLGSEENMDKEYFHELHPEIEEQMRNFEESERTDSDSE